MSWRVVNREAQGRNEGVRKGGKADEEVEGKIGRVVPFDWEFQLNGFANRGATGREAGSKGKARGKEKTE